RCGTVAGIRPEVECVVGEPECPSGARDVRLVPRHPDKATTCRMVPRRMEAAGIEGDRRAQQLTAIDDVSGSVGPDVTIGHGDMIPGRIEPCRHRATNESDVLGVPMKVAP